jgi:hypothetical protein
MELIMKKQLSEGETLRNFILNEMDYYVPDSGTDEFGYETEAMPDEHLGDAMASDSDEMFDDSSY